MNYINNLNALMRLDYKGKAWLALLISTSHKIYFYTNFHDVDEKNDESPQFDDVPYHIEY